MIRKYHNHKPQTTPWHREEEPPNLHETPGRQPKQSIQLPLPHQDDCYTRMDLKKHTTKNKTITDSHNGSNNKQKVNNNRTTALERTVALATGGGGGGGLKCILLVPNLPCSVPFHVPFRIPFRVLVTTPNWAQNWSNSLIFYYLFCMIMFVKNVCLSLLISILPYRFQMGKTLSRRFIAQTCLSL